jgi:diguanylate cyclase (GGDEF)-like protein
MHILIVDDSEELRAVVERFLHSGGFPRVSQAASAEETYGLLGLSGSKPQTQAPIDLVILDINLPGTNGIEACERIKSDPQYRDLPIVMLTGSTDIELLERSFDAGASDYITKPFHSIELLARLRSLAKLRIETEQRKAREQELLAVKRDLEDALEALERLSRRDSLTGVSNRRDFDETLQREWNRARRHRSVISLALVDIDHFKRFNDTHGHPFGDSCLVAVAEALRGTAKRGSDLVARYGGEEFAVLYPDTGYDDALRRAQALREAVAALRIEDKSSDLSARVTVSIGVATLVPSGDLSPSQLIKLADMALYDSKAAGRNRVTRAGSVMSRVKACDLRETRWQ